MAQDINGNYFYKTDPKFRVSVPSPWRPLLGENFQLLKAERQGEPTIIVLTEEDYNERIRLIREFEGVDAAIKREAEGQFHASCRPATINDQGKLLIPKEMAEDAGIKPGGAVTLEGRGKHFAIWDPERYEIAKQRLSENEKLKAMVEALGIFS